MTHTDLQVSFEKGKSLACVLTTPSGKASPVGVMLAHGAGGDMHSGNLAHHAESFANAGFLCLRFTCKPTRLPYRVKACQVSQFCSLIWEFLRAELLAFLSSAFTSVVLQST